LNLDSDLSYIGSGQEVARVFAFQHTATTNGVRDWSYMDAALATFAAHHVRVIMVLTDTWSGQPCTDSPTNRTIAWYQTGYKTDVEGATTYRDWVAQVVARYRNNPTIAIWQLVNEAEDPQAAGDFPPYTQTTCPWQVSTDVMQAFANDMAGLVKSIDPNHLVSLGALQGYCGSDTSSWQVTQSGPNIDVMDYHDYGYPYSPLGDPDSNGFTASLARAAANNKALIVGEMGMEFTLVKTPTTAYRATLFDAKLAAQFAAGSAGELFYMWSDGYSATPPRDMEITYGDPAIGLLAKY
jgi:mannan endo-1,4-beta-mannosidase